MVDRRFNKQVMLDQGGGTKERRVGGEGKKRHTQEEVGWRSVRASEHSAHGRQIRGQKCLGGMGMGKRRVQGLVYWDQVIPYNRDELCRLEPSVGARVGSSMQDSAIQR